MNRPHALKLLVVALSLAIGRFAQAAMLRFALEQWKYYLHDNRFIAMRPADAPARSFYGTGLHTFGRKTADDDPLVVGDMDEFGLSMRECYVHVHYHHKLWKYADLPWLGRGDWFYIHKLAETIKAYCGIQWQRL